MNRTIHLCNGEILCIPAKERSCTSLTIVHGQVEAIDSRPPTSASIVDLKGKCAIPAFVDSHLHLTVGASGLGTIDLRQVRSKKGFVSLLQDGVTPLSAGQWLVASGWSERTLGVQPDRTWLATCTDVPTICFRIDLHAAVINDVLISMLDMDAVSKMPGGAQLQKGFITEDALFDGVCALMPPVPPSLQIIRSRDAIQDMLAQGITLIGTMERQGEIDQVLLPLQSEKLIRLRAICLDLPTEEIIQYCDSLVDGPFLEVIGFKAFVDGTLGSRTAKMYAPWNDRDHDGVFAGIAADGELCPWAVRVAKAGYAPVIHAIGDRAVRMAMDAIDPIDPSLLPRIEHAQFIAEKDMPYVAGKWFGVQPLHQLDDVAIVEEAVGKKRATTLHQWRGMLDAGAHLSFGSDWPVVTPNPIGAMAVAIEQGLTPLEALVASTQDAALSLQTPLAGRLEVGCYGDVVILDHHPLHCDWKKDLPSVTMTILDGNIVYRKEINDA